MLCPYLGGVSFAAANMCLPSENIQHICAFECCTWFCEKGERSSICVLLQGFPKDGAGRVAAMAFHGGIASILGLYTLFWMKLNLMQTLPWLLVLGIFTTVAGYNALSQQADSRLKQQ